MGLLVRAFLVGLAIIAAESVQGALRRLLTTDDLFARQVATLTGALIVLAISYLTIRPLAPRNARGALAIGALWVVLTFRSTSRSGG